MSSEGVAASYVGLELASLLPKRKMLAWTLEDNF